VSYCRWSDNDSQCDVYVYEDCYGGYTTHVARVRRIPDEPLPPTIPFTPENKDAWLARYHEVSQILARTKATPIGLPFDGESFNDDTPEECADRLEMLRGLGYVVPQYAIDALRDGG